MLVTVCFDHIEHETRSAYLLAIDGEEIWIPKSQIRNFDEFLQEFKIPAWLAIEKGLQ